MNIEALRNLVLNSKDSFLKLKDDIFFSPEDKNRILDFYVEVVNQIITEESKWTKELASHLYG
jgi:hypothetical protein